MVYIPVGHSCDDLTEIKLQNSSGTKQTILYILCSQFYYIFFRLKMISSIMKKTAAQKTLVKFSLMLRGLIGHSQEPISARDFIIVKLYNLKQWIQDVLYFRNVKN